MTRLKIYYYNDLCLVRDVFIETGTYHGKTLQYAAEAEFKELHSIECKEENYLIACDRLKDFDNAKIYHGTSPDILPEIIDGEKETTFWLDAHYQGGAKDEMHEKYGECPLLEELKVITSVEWKTTPYILIDDYHCFTGDFWSDKFDRKQWPTLDQIKALLPKELKINIANDIMYCLPNNQMRVPFL